MKIALVHDWLLTHRGGEKVLEAICEIFPKADLYTLIHKPQNPSSAIENRKIFSSFLQIIPGVYHYYRYLLPLMPYAIRRLDLSSYDLVISSHHCVAKGVYLGREGAGRKEGARPPGTPYAPGTGRKEGARPLHLCYCNTPMRYIWDQYQDYFESKNTPASVRFAMRKLRPWLQNWDRKTAGNVDHFIANSENVRQRIQRFYGRESTVIHPPVDVDFYGARPGSQRDPACWSESEDIRPWGYYLMVTSLVPYKKTELAIEAFNRLKLPLKIIGSGPEEKRLKAMAGSFVEFLGWQPEETIRWHYQRAQALIFPGEEDFGIVPVEAQAAGCPVIAYGKGGALETVREGESGLFFTPQTSEALAEAVRKSQNLFWDRQAIQHRVRPFHKQEFLKRLRSLIEESLAGKSAVGKS